MTRVRVLLVEDSATYGELATLLLEEVGCVVTRAATAEEGLRLAREEPPDVIMMDTNLPGMDGFHAVRMLRDDPRTRHIPAVGMTADRIRSDEALARARAAGFDAYIEKPVDHASFRRLLQRFVEVPDRPS